MQPAFVAIIVEVHDEFNVVELLPSMFCIILFNMLCEDFLQNLCEHITWIKILRCPGLLLFCVMN